VACALFSCFALISRSLRLNSCCDRVAGTLGSMRSPVWLRHRHAFLLSCVSCPCVRWAATGGTASLCSFGLVVLGLGPVSQACVLSRGPGIPCLVGLGDGAVVFGHQGLIWVCDHVGGWWRLTWGCCACRGYVCLMHFASPLLRCGCGCHPWEVPMSKSLPGPPLKRVARVFSAVTWIARLVSPQQAERRPVMTSSVWLHNFHQVGDSHFRRGTMNLSGTVRVSFAPHGSIP
jgi:hypothetical protein